MALVGSYVALVKPLLAVMPVFLLAWLRFGIGGLAMLHWLKKPADEAPLSAATRGWLFLESLLGNFLFSIFMLYGMRLTSAVAAGIIMAAIPAVVAVMSRFFLREHMTRHTRLAVLCAVAGMAMAAGFPSGTSDSATPAAAPNDALLGNLLVFAAVLCEAAYAVIGRKLTRTLSARRISSIINLWGFALMTPMGLTLALGFDFAALTASTWALLVFYALAASVWTVWLWMTGLETVPASHIGVFTVFLPIAAALVGVLALGETLGPVQLMAFAIALWGVALATRPDGVRSDQAP